MKNVKVGHACPVVCLDAGHAGRYNRSNVVPEYYESEMNWKLHLLLKSELEKYGIQVVVTRTDINTDLSLYKRGKVAEDSDAMISVHSNACDAEYVDRPVGIYFVDDDCGQIDEQSKELADILSNVVAEVMQTDQKAQVYCRKSTNDPNEDYYTILYSCHKAGTAGIILEHSFHTNTRAAKWLLEESNLLQLAKAEAAALARYFDLEPLPFDDVPKNAWYRDAVEWAWRRGITQGRDENRFDPDTPITRAELVTMLYRFAEGAK